MEIHSPGQGIIQTVIVELVQTTTTDGVRLDGALHPPLNNSTQPCPSDILLCVHGTGGAFYTSAVFEMISQHFSRKGTSVLRVNTRGHDSISTASTREGGRRQGAAYERVDDCRKDLTAWCRFLTHKGFTRIHLLGHSLGAVKSIYCAATEVVPQLSSVLALSPPRLSHSWFLDHHPAFLDIYRQAEGHVQRGTGKTLMEVSFPLPMLITADGYLEKYGPDEQYNFLQYLDPLPARMLVTFGGQEIENHIAFQGLPQLLESHRSTKKACLDVQVIPHADHFYSQHLDLLVRVLDTWLLKED